MAPVKLGFHRKNRTHRVASAETHRYFNIRFFGQMPPDASDFPGGIPALEGGVTTVVNRRRRVNESRYYLTYMKWWGALRHSSRDFTS